MGFFFNDKKLNTQQLGHCWRSPLSSIYSGKTYGSQRRETQEIELNNKTR